MFFIMAAVMAVRFVKKNTKEKIESRFSPIQVNESSGGSATKRIHRYCAASNDDSDYDYKSNEFSQRQNELNYQH